MRITIVTPLFPPDIGAPAPYVKEVAGRLTGHEVQVVCFGRFPESVANVVFYTVSKRSRTLIRIWRFMKTVLNACKNTDVLYVQNGPSVELGALLASLITHTPIVYVVSDELAWEQRSRSLVRNIIATLICMRSRETVFLSTEQQPLERPEILPFHPDASSDLENYETAWQTHLALLNERFDHTI